MRPAPGPVIHHQPNLGSDDAAVLLTAGVTSYLDTHLKGSIGPRTPEGSGSNDCQWDDGPRALPLESCSDQLPHRIGPTTGRVRMATAFCGIDWADDHHDLAIIDN